MAKKSRWDLNTLSLSFYASCWPFNCFNKLWFNQSQHDNVFDLFEFIVCCAHCWRIRRQDFVPKYSLWFIASQITRWSTHKATYGLCPSIIPIQVASRLLSQESVNMIFGTHTPVLFNYYSQRFINKTPAVVVEQAKYQDKTQISQKPSRCYLAAGR